MHVVRLALAGRVLARHGVVVAGNGIALPTLARLALRLARLRLPFARNDAARAGDHRARLSAALVSLGPSYVKLGQFLATRPDVVGAQTAADLSELQDRLPPFSRELALEEVRRGLGAEPDELFEEIGPPVAAASIAQVHRGRTREPGGAGRDVAIKILRPAIEQRFARDLASFEFAARMIERIHQPSRRLRPVDAVATLARSVQLEMDLRMEASAIAEMAHNTRDDPGFRVPEVDWQRTSRRVLTTEWIDGIPLGRLDDLRAAGHDLAGLAETIIQSFLRHAMRDGFFHADMHPGNLFADPRTGDVVAVDFGIMGRINRRERRFLADILYGFITRNYRLVAERHFEIGYVPKDQSVDDFALAIRSIGEPLHGRTAADISMARVLGQLFAITDLFSMQTRPELVLLQKSMVLVEGVARSLDPELDIWTVAEPVVGEWLRKEAGPLGRLEDLKDHFTAAADAAGRLPAVLAQAELALSEYNLRRHAPQRGDRLMRWALLGLIGVTGLAMLALLWRLVTLPPW